MNARPQLIPLGTTDELPGEVLGSLATLRPGNIATVIGLKETTTDTVAKLLALGVVPGIQVKLESVGPAVVFRMGHARFAVDRALASAILVQGLQSEER